MQSRYIYSLKVTEDAIPTVCESDILAVTDHLGHEVNVFDDGDGEFTLEADRAINMEAVKHDVEELDGATHCKVVIECILCP